MARRSAGRSRSQRHPRRRRLRRGRRGDGVQVLWRRDRSAAVKLVFNRRWRIHRARLDLLGPRGVARARPRPACVRRLGVVSAHRFEPRPQKPRHRESAAPQRHHAFCRHRRQRRVRLPRARSRRRFCERPLPIAPIRQRYRGATILRADRECQERRLNSNRKPVSVNFGAWLRQLVSIANCCLIFRSCGLFWFRRQQHLSEPLGQPRLLLVSRGSGCNMATILSAETERQSWVSYCKRFIGTARKRKIASTNGGHLLNPNCRRLRKLVSRLYGFRPRTRQPDGNRWATILTITTTWASSIKRVACPRGLVPKPNCWT